MPTRDLPPDPNLEHLRNQAKTLQQLVRGGDPDALASVREFHPRLPTVAAGTSEAAGFSRADAQWVLARQYGLSSWTQLRRHAETIIRPVDSLTELATAFDVVGAQYEPPLDHTDRRFADQARRWPADRALMLAAECRDRIIGGGFAFRHDSAPGCTVTLRLVAMRPDHRHLQLERRTVRRIEAAAVDLGVAEIVLGGITDAERAFYLNLGYRGRHDGGLMTKQLPQSAMHRNPTGWRTDLERLRTRRASRLAT